MELASWLIWIWIFSLGSEEEIPFCRENFVFLSFSLSILECFNWIEMTLAVLYNLFLWNFLFFLWKYHSFLVFRYLSLCLVWWKKKYSKRIDRRIDQVHLYCTIIWNEFCFLCSLLFNIWMNISIRKKKIQIFLAKN